MFTVVINDYLDRALKCYFRRKRTKRIFVRFFGGGGGWIKVSFFNIRT